MAVNSNRIKIVKGDFQLEAEGDKAFVKEMINRFASDLPDATLMPAKSSAKEKKLETSVQLKNARPLSISEFIRQLGLKKHIDMVLAFGYYLEKYSGLEEFTPADINACYYDAKMESSNTSQMISLNIKSSRIMQAKKEKGKRKNRWKESLYFDQLLRYLNMACGIFFEAPLQLI
jgi:hypothetical protein